MPKSEDTETDHIELLSNILIWPAQIVMVQNVFLSWNYSLILII